MTVVDHRTVETIGATGGSGWDSSLRSSSGGIELGGGILRRVDSSLSIPTSVESGVGVVV